jgi:hypothetical protein
VRTKTRYSQSQPAYPAKARQLTGALQRWAGQTTFTSNATGWPNRMSWGDRGCRTVSSRIVATAKRRKSCAPLQYPTKSALAESNIAITGCARVAQKRAITTERRVIRIVTNTTGSVRRPRASNGSRTQQHQQLNIASRSDLRQRLHHQHGNTAVPRHLLQEHRRSSSRPRSQRRRTCQIDPHTPYHSTNLQATKN